MMADDDLATWSWPVRHGLVGFSSQSWESRTPTFTITRPAPASVVGDPREVDALLDIVAGPDHQESSNKTVPGGLDQARRDADTFFSLEIPAMNEWTFGEEVSRG
jgi:hypothetical protein